MSSSDPGKRRPADQKTGENDGADPVKSDFGAFVSSRVRSSAAQFRGESGSAPVAAPAASTTRARGDVGAEAPTDSPAAEQQGTPPIRRRPSRYWRDAVGEPEANDSAAATEATPGRDRQRSRVPNDPEMPDDDGAGGRPPLAAWFRENSEGRPWFLPALIVAAVLILLLVVYLLTQIGGGNDDPPTPGPTATVESVIDNQPLVTRPAPTPTAPLVPTPTPRTGGGGDNQRNNPPSAGETPTPESVGLIPQAPIAYLVHAGVYI